MGNWSSNVTEQRHSEKGIESTGLRPGGIFVHGIIATVGADLRVCPYDCPDEPGTHAGVPLPGIVQLDDVGWMVEKWWSELNHKSPTVQTDQFIVMPNHVYRIIATVGANLRICPYDCPDEPGTHTGVPLLGIVQLDDVGWMVEKWWSELNHKSPTVQTDQFIVMPNHVYRIIAIVGADLRVCPYDCPDATKALCSSVAAGSVPDGVCCSCRSFNSIPCERLAASPTLLSYPLETMKSLYSRIPLTSASRFAITLIVEK